MFTFRFRSQTNVNLSQEEVKVPLVRLQRPRRVVTNPMRADHLETPLIGLSAASPAVRHGARCFNPDPHMQPVSMHKLEIIKHLVYLIVVS